jgi:hypothetical protein
LRARRDSRSQPPTPAPKFLSVCDGQRCVGFILARGKDAFEAFDRDEKPLGVFASTRDAAAAISPKETAT